MDKMNGRLSKVLSIARDHDLNRYSIRPAVMMMRMMMMTISHVIVPMKTRLIMRTLEMYNIRVEPARVSFLMTVSMK